MQKNFWFWTEKFILKSIIESNWIFFEFFWMRSKMQFWLSNGFEIVWADEK